MNQVEGVNQETIESIFYGIDDVIASNDTFLSDLKERQDQSVVVEKIGDLLLKRAQSFLCYSDFVGRRPHGDLLLQGLSKNPQISYILKVFPPFSFP